MTRWLITGGCGFIGTNLVRVLLEEGADPADIRVLDNLSVGAREDLARVADLGPGGVELIEGDIRDAAAIGAAAEGRDVIVHLAGWTGVAPSVEDPLSDCENNVIGTLRVLEAARATGARRVVFASSGAPVGLVEPPIVETLAPNPASPYGASKLAAGGYCLAYANCFGLETVALRFGNVYGPYSDKKSSVVAKFVLEHLRGAPSTIHGDGTATRDFVHVEDLIAAILAAARTDPANTGEIYQIATNSETNVRRIAELIDAASRELGLGAFTPEMGPPRQGDVPRNFSDITKARTRLGWEPKRELAEGVRDTLIWHARRLGRLPV